MTAEHPSEPQQPADEQGSLTASIWVDAIQVAAPYLGGAGAAGIGGKVVETYIKERGATERTKIEQDGKTARAKLNQPESE
ncbi:hypothetical protein [Skermania piniformis]|uniref:Uncharacterized protein n=1 Tax=Skermania pinensis TaxID=39122 RepID=A0ABX8S733_9ACTN|nr:hypothetical protein [Skermania piniformis]QXQ12814.1 hypothetical protein KV203_12845 [Skermania piniformis]